MKTLEELTALQQDFLDAGYTAEFSFRMACLTLLKKSLKSEFDKDCETADKAVSEHAKAEILKHLNTQIRTLQKRHWKGSFLRLFRRIFQRENQAENHAEIPHDFPADFPADLHPAIIPIRNDFSCIYALTEAISQGQCAILLASPETKDMSEWFKAIIEDNFTEDFVAVYTPSENNNEAAL
jgi:hypothetical protein